MRLSLSSVLIISLVIISFWPGQGRAKIPPGPFHKVAFVVTISALPDGSNPIDGASNEGDVIGEKLNEAGYLVIRYPDPKYQVSFEQKLAAVKQLSQSSNQPGDVTLFYYIGHGALSADGTKEQLIIPKDNNAVFVNDIRSDLSSPREKTTVMYRALLLFINACRDNGLSIANSATHDNDDTRQTDDDDLVLESTATTNGLAADMNLAHLIGEWGLDPSQCDSKIFPGIPKFAATLVGPNSVIDKRAAEAKKELSSYADMDLSPFGAALLLSIEKPNRSLFDINSSIGASMRCFTQGIDNDFPVVFTPGEVPAFVFEHYYFGTKRPDIDFHF